MINIKINLGVLLLLGATYASSDHALRGLFDDERRNLECTGVGLHDMCHREVITNNNCCDGAVCKQLGNPDYAVRKCCIDYNGGDCVKNKDCCDGLATCVKPVGSGSSDPGTCCLGKGISCTEGDGGCCNGLLCTGGICADCLGNDESCLSGGLGCCDGLVCTQPALTYSPNYVNTCVPCARKDEPCFPWSSPGVPACCGELECYSRYKLGVGYHFLCSDCIPVAQQGCRVDHDDCCDSHTCHDYGYGMTQCI